MRSKKVKKKGIYNGGLMMKRGRGRPRTIHSHNLAQEMVNFSNGNVSYSDNLPEFFKIYMPALSSKMLRIPPDFIDKFGGNIPTTCTIKRPWGVSWQVDINRVNDCWFFQKGWPNFVEENSLRDGDFLTFCYVGKSIFCVTIFSPNGCAKGAAAHTSSSRIDQTSQSENCEINEAKQRKVSRWGSSIAYINGNPCFSIVLMKTHVKMGILRVPLEFWRAHMKKSKRSREVITLWVENDAWDVGVVNYGDRVLFQKGCPKFIKDNSLKFGTSCTFQLIDSSHLSFKVTFST